MDNASRTNRQSIYAEVTSRVENADVETFRKNFKKCSDLVEAHDPSRARDGAVPPPDDILADIKTLGDWGDSIKNRQNALR